MKLRPFLNATTGMTSMELARRFCKTHSQVCYDVEKLNKKYMRVDMPTIEASEFYNEQTDRHSYGYHLTYAQTLDLVTGYSTMLRIEANRQLLRREQELLKLGQEL